MKFVNFSSFRLFAVSFLIASATFLFVACGGGESTPSAQQETSSQTTSTASTEAPAQKAEEPEKEEPKPEPKAEEPKKEEPKAEEPKKEEPKPESPPAPEPKEPELYEGFFVLKKGVLQGVESTDIETYGWLKDAADTESGLVSFDYNGVSVTLYWRPFAESGDDLLNSSYSLLTASRPSMEFSAINDGSIEVNSDSEDNKIEGKYASFSAKNADGVLSGGLMGVWVCTPSGDSGSVDRGFTLTTTGADATTAQLRFNRLLGAFQCGE